MSRRILWLLLAIEAIWIFSVLLNFDNAWMHPEKTRTHWWILENGPTLQWEDLRRGMNVRTLEWGAPRITRPLSNLFEVLNAKFRATLWRAVPPHPSVSLTWPFVFLLLPPLLYATLRRMGCRREIALGSVGLYAATMGFLSPVVMLFHPGKCFVNLFAVLSLYLGSRIVPRLNSDSARSGRTWALLAALFVTLFTGFFWDETALFVYVLVFVLFAPYWIRRSPWRPYILAGFAVLPLAYLFMVQIFLPKVQVWLGYGEMRISEYPSFPSPIKLFLPDLRDLLANARYLFSDHIRLRLGLLGRESGWWLSLWFILHAAVLLAFGGWAIVAVARRARLRAPADGDGANSMLARAGLSLLLLAAYIWFQTFQLSNNLRVWGSWWYGSMFSLLYVLVLAFVAETVLPRGRRWVSWIVVVLFAIWTADTLLFSTCRNAIFKVQNLSYAIDPQDIFTGRLNEYRHWLDAQSFRQARDKREYLRRAWSAARGRPLAVHGDPATAEAQCRFLDNARGILKSEVLTVTPQAEPFVLQPDNLQFADVNGDGRADALLFDTTIRDAGLLELGLADGAGFGPLNQVLHLWVEGDSRLDGKGKDADRRMQYADVNGDRRADALYFETWRSFSVYVCRSLGATFDHPQEGLRLGRSTPTQLRFADVNGDGRADALYFQPADGALWVLLSTGSTFESPHLAARPGIRPPETLRFADVNGDGRADLVIFETADVLVALSRGATFDRPVPWAQASIRAASLADVNGDGKADLIDYDAAGSGRVRVWRSTGEDFAQPEEWGRFAGARPRTVHGADVNGDGRADLLWVDPVTYRIVVQLSNGEKFEAAQPQRGNE